ncbi:hypothetical protein DICPUDRAFT_46161 [Dictyostelium purpureum]|uniref:Dickkopf N-terminal cysteine-rich domain-containing protein n=1 Tax=Dictyostelium purpureum TaxID=5786 RepID=F0ZDQ7_DICPU|nr:uncharacterized protein DICPUDRAFT_46161 [Dictyostelium purpureum]EGC37888.1 hypothetical protein DICPUDRAFT_46161 [Dictyostelium purpureum]|eukprot:XP_003285548.1 hypothetical protein DICPUDRAFT_46161 [Dictyostelium purpureum]
MKKFLINIFLLLIICKLSNSQIPTAALCTNDPNIIEGGLKCNGTGDSCALGYYCSSNKCMKTTEFASACQDDSECSPYYCNQGKCGNAYFAIAGESCTNDKDCIGRTQLKCVSNVCSLPEGASCTQANECGLDKNCKDSKCTAASKEGDACNDRYDCPVNLVCTYSNNDASSMTCQKPWTKAVGDKCDNSVDAQRIPFFYDCDIGKNLYCGAKGVCVADKPSESCTKCNEGTACSGYSESCVCNNHGVSAEVNNTEKFGVCVPQVYITNECKTTFNNLISCCAENSCPMTQSLLLNQGSCAFKKCSQYSCEMSNCFRATGEYNMLNLAKTACKSYKLPQDYTSKCPTSNDQPNHSNSMLPSIIFSIIFVFVMIILS